MHPPKPIGDDCGNCILFGALQAIPDGMVLLDGAGRILHVNAVAQSLLGLEGARLGGAPFAGLLSDPGMSAFWAAASTESGTVSGELGLRGATLRVSVAPCRTASGERLGHLLILRDVSEEKKIRVELSEEVAARLASLAASRPEPAEAPELALLTRRERQVLAHLAGGQTNAQIAARLHVSANTVASHLKNLYAKLGLGSRSEAAAFAVRHGITLPR